MDRSASTYYVLKFKAASAVATIIVFTLFTTFDKAKIIAEDCLSKFNYEKIIYREDQV